MSVATGKRAEEKAAEYLMNKGFIILAMNWRTRRCEIDLVAKKRSTIYFVEVKYRQQQVQGAGFDYITQKKLTQMQYAAEIWMNDHSWSGDVCLAAIEVSGPDFVITGFMEGYL